MSFDNKVDSITPEGFGGVIDAGERQAEFFEMVFNQPNFLSSIVDKHDGLLLIKGLSNIVRAPALLVKLSHLFGNEVENYRETTTPRNMIHGSQDQILVISNMQPYDRQPPIQPDPPVTASGGLPIQFPHRRGWHTDQSFRRPPPDVSLFYAVKVTPHGQGQTLFANGYAAYAALSDELKEKVKNLNGLHALLGTGRTEQTVRAGVEPTPLLDHQKSQFQPVVRVHPMTRKKALYLCESGQMDWLDGPMEGMTPGPDGDGAALLYELMNHYTDEKYGYVHEWDEADLVVYDNRCLIHSATWFDADKYDRLMWRTTVSGNPGPEYDGEKPSWIPDQGLDILEGLGDARWDNKTRV